nr:MAG TPA: hypothetical protein [Caudoviricetes sp.]
MLSVDGIRRTHDQGLTCHAYKMTNRHFLS